MVTRSLLIETGVTVQWAIVSMIPDPMSQSVIPVPNPIILDLDDNFQTRGGYCGNEVHDIDMPSASTSFARRWSCRWSCRGCTTATPRSLGFQSTSTADYSQCWTLPPDSSTGKVGANTSPLFCESSIGYGPKSVSTSNSPFSFSVVFTVWRHAIYPTTYVASPTPIAFSCIRHCPVHCLSRQRGLSPWVTVPSQLPAVDSGTICRTRSPLLPRCLFSPAI